MSDHFDKDGFLFKRAGSTKKNSSQKKWKAYYFNLIDGSLHYYTYPDDAEPKASIQLQGLELIRDVAEEGAKTKFVFQIKGGKRDLHLCAEDDEDRKSWCDAIEAGFSKETAPPLKKEKRKGRAQELAFKMKKNAVGKAVASPLGKRAIRSQAPEEVRNLVGALRRIIERESKSSKKAGEIEEAIFKVGIKSYFLIEGEKVTMEDLLVADKPLRSALELLAKCHDHAKYSRNPNEKLLVEKFDEVSKMLHEGASILTKTLSPHLKAKNVSLIKETVDYLGDPVRLLRIFKDTTLDEDLQELMSACEHYTQFHFYAEK